MFRPGEKLSISVSDRMEIRQVLISGAPDLITPIFGVSAQYQLFEQTSFSLGANRVVSPSLFLNEITETTSINASVRQRIVKRLFLDLTGGYTKTSYHETFFGFDLSRQDDGTFFNARLSAALLKRGTAAIFYQTNENTSTASGFAFSSTQVGFELGYRF